MSVRMLGSLIRRLGLGMCPCAAKFSQERVFCRLVGTGSHSDLGEMSSDGRYGSSDEVLEELLDR